MMASSSVPATAKEAEEESTTTMVQNWLELPIDITFSILLKLDFMEMVITARQVCSLWRSICKDPLNQSLIWPKLPDPIPHEYLQGPLDIWYDDDDLEHWREVDGTMPSFESFDYPDESFDYRVSPISINFI
jgi:hypothetical protein